MSESPEALAAQLAAMQAQLHALQAKVSSLQPASAKQLADDHAGQQPLIVPVPPPTAPAAAAEMKFIDIVFGFGSIIEDSSRSRSKDHETGRLAPVRCRAAWRGRSGGGQ